MKGQSHAKFEEKIAYAPEMNPDPEVGLSEEQVEQRKSSGLINKTQKRVTKSVFKILCDNLFNFLNILLIIIFVAMIWAGLGWTYYLFMVILVCNITIGVIQDVNARRLVNKLRVLSDPKVRVVRNSNVAELSSEDVVLSDVLIFSSGNQICADCVILSGTCTVDESLLTGESEPIKKQPGDQLFSGTYIKSGECRAKTVKVGAANYSENLQNSAKNIQRPKSEIKNVAGFISGICGGLAVAMGILMLGVWLIPYFARGELPSRSEVTTNIASISGSMVAMIPAGLFLLTSLALAVGVINLSKKRVLVQQLHSLEMLARVDCLCLDKTGTITDGNMNVFKTIPSKGHQVAEIQYAVANILAATSDTNATALALENEFGKHLNGYVIECCPFSSENKYSGVCLDEQGSMGFGAYGFLPTKENDEIRKEVDRYSTLGYRVLVVATYKKDIKNGKLPDNGEIIGLIVLSDHIKEDAPETLAWFQKNGVLVKVISGDNPVTVSEVAAKAGVANADKYISLEGKSLEEVATLAERYTVFGRVSPEQKDALIKALKQSGKTVAMTGDGVNDILALKSADCSIAMAKGADAAKNVSHLVMLDSDFSKLPDVVAEGRRVINNLQRSCSLFLAKTFFAITVSLIFLIGSLPGINGKPYPFTTKNLLIWETMAIGGAAFFLALQPSNEKLKGSFAANILLKSIPAGIAATIAGLIPFVLALCWPQAFTNATSNEEIWGAAITLATICFTAMGYVILFKTSLPRNKYRLFVFFAMLVLGVITLLFERFVFKRSMLDINLRDLPWQWYITFIVITAVVGSAYWFAYDFFMEITLNKKEKFNENQSNS